MWRFIRKLNTELPCDQATPLLGTYPPEVPQWLRWLNTSSSVCFFSTLSPEFCCFHSLNVFLSVSSLFQLRPYPGECGHLTCLPVSWPHSTSTHPPHTNWKISILCIKLFTAFWRIKGYYQKSEKATHRMRENICKPRIWQAFNIAYR